MGLRFFNTLSRRVEEFTPLDPAGKRVGMYCCGPTVYDFAHIGNFRTFVFADLVRRYLEFKQYQVCHVMNITDVDDKIIARVNQEGIKLDEFTKRYENAFFEDFSTLNCLRPHFTPRATEHIQEMIDLIQKLLDRGIAYRAVDGSVYFSIEKYVQMGYKYGQLTNLNFDQMRPGARIKSDEYAKESFADFALWKARTPDDGNVFWKSPWGEGRPGWHIECSAMSFKHLGPSFDIHLGGEDLAFPHHEDEIAQSEGAGLQSNNTRFVRYWLHGAHLLVEGKKMSKSLGNFYTLRDLIKRGYSGREIRFLMLTAHYRDPLNFTFDGLNAARASLTRIDDFLLKLREIKSLDSVEPDKAVLSQFEAALDNDLNISAAWAVIFDWIRDVNKMISNNELISATAAVAEATWRRMDEVLGVGRQTTELIPQEILDLANARQKAREQKDFKTADQLRNELRQKGWIVEDTSRGPRLKRI